MINADIIEELKKTENLEVINIFARKFPDLFEEMKVSSQTINVRTRVATSQTPSAFYGWDAGAISRTAASGGFW